MSEQTQGFTSELTTAGEIEKSLATTTHNGYMAINGLEGIPTSVLGIPRVKVVQPMSTGVELANGNDAPMGVFHFSDSMTTKPSIRAAFITAKKQTVIFQNDDGSDKPTDRIGIIFQDLDTGKNYLTDLSVTSFRSFGKLVGLMAAEEWENAWDKEITMTTEKRERQTGGGKYWVVNFQVGDKLPADKETELAELWTEYGNYFEREGEPS